MSSKVNDFNVIWKNMPFCRPISD